MMVATRIILLLTILILFTILATICTSNRRRGSNQLFVLHLFGVVGWAFFILLNTLMPHITGISEYAPGDIGYVFEKIIFASTVVWVSANYWFVQTFAHIRIKRSFFNGFMGFFQLLIFILTLLDNVFYTKIIIHPLGYTFLAMQPASLLFSTFVFSHLFIPIVALARARKRTKEEHRRAQMSILVKTYGVFFCVSLMTNWILPVYFGIFTFNAFGPTLSLIVAGGVIYAISKYQFLDIRAAIQRGIIFTTLLFCVVGSYIFFLLVIGSFLPTTAHFAPSFSAGLTCVIGVFTVPSLERWLRRISDPFFYKNTYDPVNALHVLSEIVTKHLDVNMMLSETVTALRSYVKAKEVYYVFPHLKLAFNQSEQLHRLTFVYSDELVWELSKESIVVIDDIPRLLTDPDYDQLRKNTLKEVMTICRTYAIAVIVPLCISRQEVGFLLLGEKESGDRYREKDVQLLKTFAHHATLAVKKSLLYEEVKDYAENLEKKVADRTIEIQRIHKQQNQLFLDISHGLQTPLTVLKGELHFIRTKYSKDATEMYACERTIDRISKFTSDLLHLAWLESSGKDRKTPMNFSALLRNCMDDFQVLAHEGNITLTHTLAGNLFVDGNSDQLEELISNVMSNAIKYIARERRINVMLSGKGESLYLTISDTGCGISSEHRAHIFERFYRSNEAIAGSGLGLAICKRIIDNHSGKIELESEQERGVRVIIQLPLYQPHTIAEVPAGSRAP